MPLTIKFWGVRGSLPSAPPPIDWTYHVEGVLRNFFASSYRDPSQISKYIQSFETPLLGGYGAATTCVEIQSAKSQLIIDGGSGIRNLSEKIMSGTTGRSKGPFHIFMTHFSLGPCDWFALFCSAFHFRVVKFTTMVFNLNWKN